MKSSVSAEVAYFDGEFLSESDYATAQSYQMDMQRRGTAALTAWGVVTGLAVTAANGGYTVDPGLAVDTLGRLILLGAQAFLSAPQDGGTMYLTIGYAETKVPALGDGPSYIREGAVLAWQRAAAFDPAVTLVLGIFTPNAIPPFAPLGRRYAGARVGTIRFRTPDGALGPSLAGWSARLEDGTVRSGLRIDAALTALAATGGARLSITGGRLGIGTMQDASALLDVQGSNAALTGPGLLTSDDILVWSSPPSLEGTAKLLQTIHTGDLILVRDRFGNPRQAQVAKVDVDSLVTDQPLDCKDAPFTYKQALLVSVRGEQRPAETAFTIDRAGRVGVGVEFPQARLQIGSEGLAIAGAGRSIAFGGNGEIAARDSSVSLRPDKARLEFRNTGAVDWRTGPELDVRMTLTVEGRVGIGTQQPDAELDVAGAIRSTAGGFIFPDGSVQTTGQLSVPIGAVIDWWGGQFDLPVPPAYQICDGSIVKDSESPLVGQALPNLAERFIIGGASLAEPLLGDDKHLHGYDAPRHSHGMPHDHGGIEGRTAANVICAGSAAASGDSASYAHAHRFTALGGDPVPDWTGWNSDYGGAQTQEASLLPPFFGLMKLMRIK